MAIVYLGLGSNVDPEKNLRLGVAELRRQFGDVVLSATYLNAAVGFEGADFLNLVARLESDHEPASIHEQIEAIHQMAGRHRGGARYTSRPLDIDLLLYDDWIIDEAPLQLPRSDVLDFSFVLRPLSELAPDLVHPQSGRTLAEHWQECDASGHPLTRVDVTL